MSRKKICLNEQVWDNYRAGMDLNDAISNVFFDEIEDRTNKNSKFKDMSPLKMVMYDANLRGSNTIGDMVKHELNNSAFTSGGMETNQWLFPAYVETTLREALYETDYLPYICTARQGVDSIVIQSPFIDLMSDENKKSLKRARIAEMADIPTGKITMGEKAVTLFKRGRAVSFSYEVARRIKIDLMSKLMTAIVGDLAHQELESAKDVLINGDGNVGTEAKELMTSSVANDISSDDLVDAIVEYQDVNHYSADTIIVPKRIMKSIAKMQFDKNLVNGIGFNITLNIPQIKVQNLTLLGLDDVTVNKKDVAILFNRSAALIRYEENGSNIQEMDNFIRNQSKLMTFTENSGYAVMTAGAARYIKLKE